MSDKLTSNRHADTWVVVPAFNEAKVISQVIKQLSQEFRNIVVVDDCSSDGTGDLVGVKNFATVVKHPINLGQGAALQTGIVFALQQGAKYIISFDSDGQHRVEDAVKMLDHAKLKKLDVVLGSRFLSLESSSMPKSKRRLLRLATMFTRLHSGVSLTDAHNGLRVLNENAAKTIQIRQNRMAHASEITTQIGKHKLKFEEYPVEILYTDYSIAKGQRMSNSLNIIFELVSGRLFK